MAGTTPNPRLREAGSASLRRLPLYYRLAQHLLAAGVGNVSSSLVGRDLGLDPTQVRKDLEAIGLAGKPKVGFAVADLLRGIETFLGWDRPKEAVLAGAGSLGSALLRYERFREYGITIVAAFDTDPQKIGAPIGGKEVFLLDSLPGRTRRMGVELGIVATPPQAAQRVADLMVEGGIRAIWNFAPVHLRLPEHVVLQNEDLGHSLASLSLKLARRSAGLADVDHEPFTSAAAFLEGQAVDGIPELSEAGAGPTDGATPQDQE
jgi:redox-sensing transcriptional repressor